MAEHEHYLEALFQAGLFSLLGRCWLGFAAILIDGLALWYVGLPLNLPVSVLPAAAFPVFCGMMATYDRYRRMYCGRRFGGD